MFHVKISSLIQVLLMNPQLLEDMRKQSTVDVSLQDVSSISVLCQIGLLAILSALFFLNSSETFI
jgi:hypothetical protein